MGLRLDLVLSKLRVGLFFDDLTVVKKEIDRAKALLEQGGDWERRNRLKVYEALFLLRIRDLKKASALFARLDRHLYGDRAPSLQPIYHVSACAASPPLLSSLALPLSHTPSSLPPTLQVRGRDRRHRVAALRYEAQGHRRARDLTGH